MDCFEILGISKTKDVREIRKAYSKLLIEYSPEKDPEGFQRLRAAYEEAVSKANEQEDEGKETLSPIDEFMEAFEDTYKCFERRINLSSWQELLERDICYNIDTSKEISYTILAFIMDNFNFPSEIWALFDEHFSWSTKKDKLYNEFPKNFIDFVLYKINNVSTFDYEYLKNCKENNQDMFIEEFRKIGNALEDFDLYTASKSIKKAQDICPDHPGLLMLIGRYLNSSGQIEEALDLFTNIINSNKDAYDSLFYRAELYFQIGKLEEAYNDYKMVLDIKSDSAGAWYALTKCCICLKKYDEAIDHAEKFGAAFPYRQDNRVLLNSAYNFYIDSLLETIERASMDINLKYKLADAYFKTSKVEESFNILNELIQSPECTSEMYSLLCRVLMVQNKVELAYANVCKAVELFKDNAELIYLKADILDEIGRYEESIEQYDKVIELNENSSSAYNNKAYVLNKLERYNEALDCINKAISMEPEAAHSYKNKAAALLGLQLYEDCLEACEQALNKYQYLTEAYVIKMKAFIDIGLYDEALSTYNKATDLGLKDSKLYYQKARVLIQTERYDDSISFCDLAIELDESNADFYYLKGLCYYYKDEYNDAVEWFDNAINHKPYYGAAFYYKAHSLLRSSRKEDALIVIDQSISLNLQHLDSFYSLKGSIIEKQGKYEDAIEEYKKAINIDPSYADYYYSVGHAYNEMDKYEAAIEYYSKSVELNPNQVEGYVNISYSLYNLGRYEECIEYCDKSINIDSEYSVAHQNKGWSLYKLERIKEAEEECSIALKLDGNNPDVLLLKLRLLIYKGLYQDALIVCDRMLELNEEDTNARNIKNDLLERINGAKNQKKGLFKSLFK